MRLPKGVPTMLPFPVLLSLAALAVCGCEAKSQPQAAASPTMEPAKTLVVLTPHSEAIRQTFAEGFWDWYLEQQGVRVRVEWIYRGTPQCVEYVQQLPAMRAQGAPVGIPDLMFGGGAADHAALAAAGLSRPLSLGDALANVPEEVHGLPTRDPDGHWVATGLSSFGILYNEEACRLREIPPPQTWIDLADKRFFGWVAIADPRASGSHRESLAMILQSQSWDRGWGPLMRILGNARALSARSGDALRQVACGSALATFAVNFDGMMMAAESDGTLKYIDPPGATAATPDIISVLACAREPELAEQFVRYVLSEEGQTLWGVKREDRKPVGETLYHYPIDPNIYTKYAGKLAVEQNPLDPKFGIVLDPGVASWLGELVTLLVAAACDDGGHIELQRLREKIISRGEPNFPNFVLGAPLFPVSEVESVIKQYQQATPEEQAAKRAEWARLYREKYAEARGKMAP